MPDEIVAISVSSTVSVKSWENFDGRVWGSILFEAGDI
jgi:hypothetical protein